MLKNVYIIGTDCFAKALQQVLALYYTNCERLEELPSNKNKIPKFSIIICTPSILSSPARIIQIYHELFGEKVIDFSIIGGIFDDNNYENMINNNDIFGGENPDLMLNNVCGLVTFSLPIDLHQLLKLNQSEKILAFDAYENAKQRSTIFTVVGDIKKMLNGIKKSSQNKFIEIRRRILNLNLHLLLPRHIDASKVRYILRNMVKYEENNMKKVLQLLLTGIKYGK